MRRMGLGSISSELLMCGGGVRSIVLLPLVARCLEIIYIYVYGAFFYVCFGDRVGSVGMYVVLRSLLKKC